MIDNKFSEADPDFDPDNLSPEAKQVYERSKKTSDSSYKADKESVEILSSNSIIAKYKIEIFFGPKRTPSGPNSVCISIYESGKRLNGGGDDKMYWCKDVTKGSSLGCGKPIPSACIHSGIAICPSCGSAINASLLTGEQFHRLTTERLSQKIEEIFHILKDSADIYCKYDQSDIRYQAVLKEHGFEKARYLRGKFIYPLKNIIKDTSNGASLSNRFKAFLSA